MSFHLILKSIVADNPGVIGAVVVDWEGEAVAHAALDRSPDMHLIGAHGGILSQQIDSALRAALDVAPREVVLRTDAGGIVLVPLSDEYLLVVCFAAASPPAAALRKIQESVKYLERELA